MAGPVCTDAAAFKTSLDGLTSLDLRTAGLAGLQTSLESVKAASDALRVSVASSVVSAIDSFQNTLAGLKTTVIGIGDSGFLASIATIKVTISGLVDAGTSRRGHGQDRLPVTPCWRRAVRIEAAAGDDKHR